MTEQDLFDWLTSGPVDPVRYLVARDLMAVPVPQAELEGLRVEATAWSPLAALCASQRDDGSFACHEKRPTARPTLRALALMRLCGMEGRDEPVRRALAWVRSHRLKEGAYSYVGGAAGVLPCYVGIYAHVAGTMAGSDDPAIAGSLQWLLDHQRFDHKETRAGGEKRWPYKSVDSYGGCWWSVSCYHGVVAALRALAAVPPERRSKDVESRLSAAIDYLRIHRVYMASGQDKPLFRHLLRPFLVGEYRSHLLDVLEALADAHPRLCGEEWVRDALRAAETMAPDGRVLLIQNYPAGGDAEADRFEAPGRPSRFLTCQWLRVLRKFGLWPGFRARP